MIDIIIPCYNESENIPVIRSRISKIFASMTEYQYEIVFVNDGSSDDTQEVLEALSSAHPEVKYIQLSRNFGHQPALKAGLDSASADAVISMDGDLQHPFEIIPILLQKWKEGFEVVYTLRTYDEDASFFKKTTSNLFYKLFSWASDFHFEKGEGADFRLIDRNVLECLQMNQEVDPFFRGLVKWVGFKQIGIPFKTDARKSGKSNYNLQRMVKLALTGVTSFSVKPLYFAAYLGFFFSFLSLLYIPYVIHAFIVGSAISGWASLIMTVVFFGGLQLSILGIIGIYLGKVFKQTQNRPPYIIKSTNH